MMTPPRPQSLGVAARAIVAAADLDEKVVRAEAAAELWFARRLPLGRISERHPMPDRPGRPDRPLLLPPRRRPARSTTFSLNSKNLTTRPT